MKPRHSAAFCGLAAIVLAGRALACDGEKILFQDGFDSLDPAWGDASEQRAIVDGTLAVTPKQNAYHYVLNQANLFADANICVKVEFARTDDASDSSGGLLFWAEDFKHFHAFEVTSDGYFRVTRLSGERFLSPLAWKQSSAIKQGLGTWNELEVSLKGNEARFFVNGSEVGRFKGQPPEDGSLVGVEGVSPQKGTVDLRFDDLTVAK